MAGMFAAMALAPVVSQLASQLLFGQQQQQGQGQRGGRLPGNSRMIGLPNHLPSNVYMSLKHLAKAGKLQSGGSATKRKRRRRRRRKL